METNQKRQLLVIRADPSCWAVDAGSVAEIARAPSWKAGVVLDLAKMCGLHPRGAESGAEDRIVVLRKEKPRIALRASGHTEVAEVDVASVLPLPVKALGLSSSLFEDIVFRDSAPILIVSVAALSARICELGSNS
jgi:chemotaxis signal transduction protein